MQLGLREVAGLLGATERTVLRWVREDGLPSVKIGGQFRFNRTEILEWATRKGIAASSGIFQAPGTGGDPAAGLEAAIRAGGIRYRVPGTDRDSVLENAIALMPLQESVDRGFLLEVLRAREAMGSTGVGDGIAIPHVRNPIVLDIRAPMITICFLEHGIEFDAIDGKPVHTLFMLISPTIGSHLSILSRLAFGLRQPAFAGAVAERLPESDILGQAAVVDWELCAKPDSRT
jgi:nitrogen PTS system EIIA component